MKSTENAESRFNGDQECRSSEVNDDSEPPPLPPKADVLSAKIKDESTGDASSFAENETAEMCTTIYVFPERGVNSNTSCAVSANDALPNSSDYSDGKDLSKRNANCSGKSGNEDINSNCNNASRAVSEELYDNIENLYDSSHEEEKLLDKSSDIEITSDEADIGDIAVILHKPSSEAPEQTSWTRLAEVKNQDHLAREAVAALGREQPDHKREESSPFGYKACLLRLGHRRRLEILIAFGFFLWIAFFVVLAIFMNGKSSTSESFGNGSSISGYKPDTIKPINTGHILDSQSLTTVFVAHGMASDGQTSTEYFSTAASLSPEDSLSTSLPRITIPEAVANITLTSIPSYDQHITHVEVPNTIAASETTTRLSPVDHIAELENNVVLQLNNASITMKYAGYLSTPQTLTQKPTTEGFQTPTLMGSSSSTPTTVSNTISDLSLTLANVVSNPTATENTTDSNSKETFHRVTNTSLPKEKQHGSFSTEPPTNKEIVSREKIQIAEGLSTIRPQTVRESSATHLPNKLLNQLLYDQPQVLSSGKERTPNYLIGIGRADITGPAADVNMMGYANPSQIAGGLHMRQYARSFIVEQQSKRFVFVNIDACMGSMLIKLEVLKALQAVYGNVYTAENLCISGTHTHSAPAGFLQDVLFQITSKGYVEETVKAMVDGIVESIKQAHERVSPGSILINKGELLESNINRSPSAYINNPESERKRYNYNVDKDMTLLKFLNAEGKGIGMLNWFPVHATSMNNTNTLISGDNKGYAELLFEQAMDEGSLFGQSKFVAAFAQSNEGDVSPNTRGPHCLDTGTPCDNLHSTCNGKVGNCVASGPGKDMFESTKIIGNNQFVKAMELYKEARIALSGPVQVVHQYIDMSKQVVRINTTHTSRTCKPAMGFSFAAGTTDGPGAFDFKQSDRTGNFFWKTVRNFLHSPTPEQTACHLPKPILIDTGEMQSPYPWQPAVVDTQMFRVGQLLINAVPGEFSTMSGRRLRESVLEVFSKRFRNESFESVIAGLSNTYSDYITTYEEYQVQRYEGASTIYGPHTLHAYVQQYKKMATSLIESKALSGGATAHDMKKDMLSFLPGVIVDSHPFGYSFGDVLKDVSDGYHVGDVVSVQFVSGNPRNSPSINMTFLTVEKHSGDGSWTVVHTDASWHTKYIWERSSTLGSVRGLSEVTVLWEISPSTPSGRYRINHFGHYKYLWTGKVYPYHGQSKMFFVFEKNDST